MLDRKPAKVHRTILTLFNCNIPKISVLLVNNCSKALSFQVHFQARAAPDSSALHDGSAAAPGKVA